VAVAVVGARLESADDRDEVGEGGRDANVKVGVDEAVVLAGVLPGDDDTYAVSDELDVVVVVIVDAVEASGFVTIVVGEDDRVVLELRGAGDVPLCN
jgi:hypothetical protein